MSIQRHSMRGVGFKSILAAQRAYVQRSAGQSKFGLIVPEAFVRSIRDLGYRGNGDAIAELIDNALQAYAERIDVLFGYDGRTSNKKPVQLAIIDNGHGMEPRMIRMAVMWGGTHRENDRSGLGRYGYGLPCSAVSLARRFTVFSQVAGSGLYAITLDLDELTAGAYTDTEGELIVPEAVPVEMPNFIANHLASVSRESWSSGTIILLEKLDRLEWTTAHGLRENLERQFGVTYHKLCGEAALYIDGTFVEPIDPLFLTPDFLFYDLDDDRAQPLDPVRIQVRSPETNAYMGAITLRYAWFPPSFGSVDKMRDAVGVNANARFSIMKDYHGLIFSRNGRLIDVQTRTPWTTFINNDRYIKIEIEFSATLDETFGVTTSKQQVTVSPMIWNCLQGAGLPKAIEQLRNKVKEAKSARRIAYLSPHADERRLSERAMGAAAIDSGDGSSGTQPALNFHFSPYRVCFEHKPDGTFFRVDNQQDTRMLHINTAHKFYEEIYDGPVSTSELRSALEVLLFCIGDVMREDGEKAQIQYQRQLLSWSRRLDLALSMLSAHIGANEDRDVGQAAWSTDPA